MGEITLKNANLVRKIYFVGIKGVGMASLAEIAVDAGFIVAGSDVAEEFITDKVLEAKKIKVDTGFHVSDLEKFIGGKINETLVVTTAAHNGLSNPQCQFALDKGINVLTHGQAVGYFMTGELFKKTFTGVSVLGCHGKTTVSAMFATALSKVGLNPSYSVGTSEIFPLGPAGHLGAGEYFVAEADEFISDVQKDRTVKFLYQYPRYAIINNIDFDHPDVYKNLDEVKKTFEKFCLENIKDNGVLFANGDDKNLSLLIDNVLLSRKDIKIITYGENEANDYQIKSFNEIGWGSEFEVFCKGKNLGGFELSVPGYHNAKNMLAAIGFLNELGIPFEQIKKAVAAFRGTKRRQEKLGSTKNGAIVIDDYAHHPDEIDKTLGAVKNAFPEKKILCLFQPHTLSRTVAFKNEFALAFSKADQVLFLPIFTSKREGETNYDQIYGSIKKAMQENGVNVSFLTDERNDAELDTPPYFLPKNRLNVLEYIQKNFDSKRWAIVCLGAGDLYRIGLDMVSKDLK
ncbi:MAG: UDP-N-acetylmuramate--L-alanine ligase [Candidatus Levyibacteriota bacterium]